MKIQEHRLKTTFCFLCKEQSMNYAVYHCILWSSYNQKLAYSSLGHSHVNVRACSLYHLKQAQPATSNTTTNKQSHLHQHAASCYLHKLWCFEWWEVCPFTESLWIPLACRSGGLPGTEGCLGASLQSSGPTSPVQKQSNSHSVSFQTWRRASESETSPFFQMSQQLQWKNTLPTNLVSVPQLEMAQAKGKFLQL